MGIDHLYGYYINLDERGMFYADVRDSNGITVFEIKAGDDSLDEDFDFDNYGMKNKTDIAGLEKFLKEILVIKETGKLLYFTEFEERLDSSPDDFDD